MCGRVVSSLPRDVLAEHFSAEEVAGPELPPSYNAAPGATLHIVAEGTAGRRVGTMRWGLVPPWADSPDRGPRPINARAETLLTKRAFADAMRRGHRCLVPVSGFFEFKPTPEGKQPYLLTAPDGFPLAMAGLWSRWSRAGAEPVVTFTIITTAANEDVAQLHDRMPALLRPEEWDSWLDRRGGELDRLSPLLAPFPTGSLVSRPVSRRVNDARNDDPALLSA
ncbi:MAG: SOS response-associated peptidase [Actinomycetota bacterium]|nr:SOS response-associated peptidase [Actinomycetota bacterium]